jgi:asparagine synthase (glutamine-hydrolysing)
MCGIGGIIGDLRADERDTAALRLQAALRHRGPDDHACFRAPAATLVHQRLAILDPTPIGRQPMTQGPLTLTFNGEIYSFREIRDDLVRAGETFASETDTEVVLALLARDGIAGLQRMRGMFALALWDERDQSCFLARDPFGIKPLYYAGLRSGGLVFASELRAILASGLVERTIDPNGLDGFLTTGSVPEPHTMAAGVKCLEAGYWLRWKDGKTSTGRYFDLTSGEAQSPADGESLRPALANSIRHHLVSDVPVGLLLSGGVDSGALLALMREQSSGDIATFSIGVEDSALDELTAARDVARHFGARHHKVLLTQELARHWIGPFLDAVDQPTLDGFNTYCACKLASDHGCKVVLSGLGADELFGGYPSFQHVPRLMKAGKWLRPFGGRAARQIGRLQAPARLGRTLEFLGGQPNLSRAYSAFRGVFTHAEARRIRERLPVANEIVDEWESTTPARSSTADEISRLELTRYLRNQLLRDADVMSMAHGVELRVPLLDLPLFSTLQQIPAALRFAANKRLLRAAVPELPMPAGSPAKRGFDLPFSAWLRNEWSDLADVLPPLPGVSLTPWYRQWSLIVLYRWLKLHGFI